MITPPKKSSFVRTLEFVHKNIILIIIIIVVLASITSTIFIVRDNIIAKNNEENVTYEPVNTLHFSMSKINTLNPLLSNDEDVYYITQLIYDGLFELDETLNVRPVLVSSYSVNSSEGTVSIKLKSDIRFHNDSKLTAYDVKYTVDAINAVGSKSLYYDYASKIDYVQVRGNRSLKIYFSDPEDAALDNLVFPIVCSNQLGSPYDFASTTSYKPVGTGQYKYSSYNSLSRLKLKPNKDYFGDVATNKIQFEILPDKEKSTNLMTMDSITAYYSDKSNIDTIAEDKNLKINKIMSNQVEYLAFNFDNINLSKNNVRLAIARAIDTKKILKDAYMGSGVLSDSIYYPNFLGSGNKGDEYAQNENIAVGLLKQQGYRDTNEDGFLEDVKGKKLEFSILVNENNLNRVDAAKLIAQNLNDVGISTHINKVSWNEYQALTEKSDFDILIGGYSFEKKYDLRDFFNENSFINYNNPKVLSLVNKLETAMSTEKYSKTYKELKEIMSKDLPYYSLCYKTGSLVTVQHFNFEKLPTFFNIYDNCDKWSWEKRIVVNPDK
ncbi:MAG: ABC transporter substrate-binding protein [Anaerovoracaceae bacterium]